MSYCGASKSGKCLKSTCGNLSPVLHPGITNTMKRSKRHGAEISEADAVENLKPQRFSEKQDEKKNYWDLKMRRLVKAQFCLVWFTNMSWVTNQRPACCRPTEGMPARSGGWACGAGHVENGTPWHGSARRKVRSCERTRQILLVGKQTNTERIWLRVLMIFTSGLWGPVQASGTWDRNSLLMAPCFAPASRR